MPLFSYRAINEDGKEVRGSIDAPDLDAARKAVEDLHLDVIDVGEASRSRSVAPDSSGQTVPVTTFAFEGTDIAGTVRRGTIQAPTKRDAFEKLRSDQKLLLTMLAPMGTLPKYNDTDLETWQKDSKTVSVPVQSVNTTVPLTTPPPTPPKPRPVVNFTAPAVPTASTAKDAPKPVSKAVPAPQAAQQYHSIAATLRLYAGWLLAWYGLFVAVGYYATVRALPWDIPFVQAFFVSPLIFSFTIGIFLFLLLSEIHRVLHGRLILGILLAGGGIGLFLGLRSML